VFIEAHGLLKYKKNAFSYREQEEFFSCNSHEMGKQKMSSFVDRTLFWHSISGRGKKKRKEKAFATQANCSYISITPRLTDIQIIIVTGTYVLVTIFFRKKNHLLVKIELLIYVFLFGAA